MGPEGLSGEGVWGREEELLGGWGAQNVPWVC